MFYKHPEMTDRIGVPTNVKFFPQQTKPTTASNRGCTGALDLTQCCIQYTVELISLKQHV